MNHRFEKAVVNTVHLTRSFTAVSGRTDILGMAETAPHQRLVDISTALKSNGWWADVASLLCPSKEGVVSMFGRALSIVNVSLQYCFKTRAVF